jgi:hypothetical protein
MFDASSELRSMNGTKQLDVELCWPHYGSMPLDQDVNEAIYALHFGMTLPFWDRAVRLQLDRLRPVQDWAVRAVAAARRFQDGNGTPEDEEAFRELEGVMEERFRAGQGPFLYDIQAKVDGIFLLLAMRTVLTMADRIVAQLEPLGKQAEAARVRELFISRFGIVKHLRDVVIHYDEYVTGGGRRRDLIIDPNQGEGVGEDEDGYLLFVWGGNRVRLIDAGQGALDLAMSLTNMFLRAATEP